MKNEIKNNYGGKSSNLNFLSGAAKKSPYYSVPNFYPIISVSDFTEIKPNLDPKKLYAVRSSGISEDGYENSMAGQFRTHLNISTEKIDIAINDIQEHSKEKTGEIIPIVVQEMVENIAISGIAFSYDVDTNSSYTVIQIHDGIGEELVSGKVTGETYKIINNLSDTEIELHIPKTIQAVYRAIQELKTQYHTPYFDIEFALDTIKDLHVLQIRPITTITVGAQEVSKLSARYARMITYILQARGKVFGDMIDINPRELVGGEPRLIQTMFQYLFADSAIPETRKEMGYKIDGKTQITSTLNGNIYVNLMDDLRAFLPIDLPEEDVEIFFKYYSQLLTDHPDTQNRLDSELYPVTRESAVQIICSLYSEPTEQERVFAHFQNLFSALEALLLQKYHEYPEMEKEILMQCEANSYYELMKKGNIENRSIEQLIELAKKIAKEFAFYARGAFYYSQSENSNPAQFKKLLYHSSVLKSLEEKNESNLSFMQIGGFNMLKTFPTQFAYEDFPDTMPKTDINDQKDNKVELFLAARENLKFILMRVLYFLGVKLRAGGRDNLENQHFLSLLGNNGKVHARRVQEKLNILLPEVLSSKNTPLCFKLCNANGYFIGNGLVEGDTIYIDDVTKLGKMRGDIAGKILIIDHATPEIDGFLGGIRGVVTRVGGPLAHIAIRAREMDIPSVVGVGKKFDILKTATRITLDFDNKKIYAP